jgi:shikimate kinase
MPDYYDPHPLLTLERHVALVGLVAADTQRIGHQLAALTGLTLIDLERRVEHEAGRSVWEIVFHDGPRRFRELERRCLAQALFEKPGAVLVLGDGTLLDEASRQSVAAATRLVALQRDLPNCYWRLQTLQRRRAQTCWHPFFPELLQSIDQVRPFYQERQPTLAAARHAVQLAGRPTYEVVRQLMELIAQD